MDRKINVLEYVFTVLSALFMLWILVSWADVLMNNAPYSGTEVQVWNFFRVLLQLGSFIK